MNIYDFLIKISASFNLLVVTLLLAILGVMFFLLWRISRANLSDKKLDELYFNIKQQIQFAVAPKFIEISLGVNDFIELALEIWRIEQRISKTIAVIPEAQVKGLENSIQKLKRYLEKHDIEILDYKNQKFNEGLNLDVLSVEKNPSIQEPQIKETIEPTVILKGQVIRKAKVILLTK